MRPSRLLLIIVGFGVLGFALGTVIPPPGPSPGPAAFPQAKAGTPVWIGVAAMIIGVALIVAGMRTASRARG